MSNTYVRNILISLALMLLIDKSIAVVPEYITATTNLILGVQYTGFVNKSFPVGFLFQAPVDQDTNLRLHVSTPTTTPNGPKLHVSILQPNVLLAGITLPSFPDGNLDNASSLIYFKAERTLCIDRNLLPNARTNGTDLDKPNMAFTVVASTSADENVGYTFQLERREDYQLGNFGTRVFYVTPTSPVHFEYLFDSTMTAAIVEVNIFEESCMTMSIQSRNCPIHELENNVKFAGRRLTISSSGALTIKKSEEYNFKDGFIIVIVLHSSTTPCGASNPFVIPMGGASAQKPNRSPDHSIKVKLKVSPVNDTAFSFQNFINLGLPLFISLAVSAAAFFAMRCQDKLWTDSFKKSLTTENFEVQSNLKVSLEALVNNRLAPPVEGEAEQSYFYTIIAIGIFYAVPVYQLTGYYHRAAKQLGDIDMCYYNFRCAKTLGTFTDFNHFWSNICYVIFGISFLVIVNARRTLLEGIRQEQHKVVGSATSSYDGLMEMEMATSENNENIQNVKSKRKRVYFSAGVFLQFGIFQALGIALIMEGLLSAAYHLCPNAFTFQYDTCFMFIIASLLILKLYQFRHPRVFGGYRMFSLLALFVLIYVVSFLAEQCGSQTLKVIISIGISILQYFLIWIASFIYCTSSVDPLYQDIQSISNWNVKEHYQRRHVWSAAFKHRTAILPAIWFAINVALTTWWILAGVNLPTYLLYSFILSAVAHLVFYTRMKIVCHQKSGDEFCNRTWIQPAVYLMLAGITGAFAVTCFLDSAARWELEPSASRQYNQYCVEFIFFESYYDKHDLWHFLSAHSLFFTFMALLVMDDGLLGIYKCNIPVF